METLCGYRTLIKVFLYISGRKQKSSVDNGSVRSIVDGDLSLSFRYLYGWRTKGFIDEYRVYDKTAAEHLAATFTLVLVQLLYSDHNTRETP